MIRKIFIIIITILLSAEAYAQFYDVGQEPASVHWKQIKTEHFNIVFPDFMESKAQHLANMMEAVYFKDAYTLNVLPKKITIILHPSDVVSNAQVAWAPKRMEFFTTPPQDTYAQNWMDQLADHEYRHVVQLTKIDKGLTHVLSWFFGEQITAGVLAAYVPFWFIEGDAVLNETLMSESGRGRVPSFDVELRAQLIEKGPYSYDKAVYGSYKHFVPDHYVLGYHLVTMARREYGPQIWDKALKTVASYPIMVTPFNHGIRKVSGQSKVKLYKRYMHQLDSIWREPLKTLHLTTSHILTPANKIYTSYTDPGMLPDGRLIAMKSGINDIVRIVVIDTAGKVRKLCTPGSLTDISLSAAKNKIVWAELSYDPRWDCRNYSNIHCYDVKKKCKKQLTHRSRYFSPSLSKDAGKIAVAECDEKNDFALVILDAEKGKVIEKIKAPDGCEIITPCWSDDGAKIVCILLGKKGKQMAMVNFHGNEFRPLTEPSSTEIIKPVMHGKRVFFSSSLSGIDNIYALDTATKKMYAVTSVKYGAYDPCISPDGKDLLYSEYTADGNRIASIPLDTLQWIPAATVKDVSPHLYEPVLKQETGVVAPPDTEKTWPEKPYRKFCHLLNPHSWGPISVNASSNTINPGLTLMTQNKLSTLFGTLGYEYTVNEKQGKYFADVSFRQWYPIFDFRFETGGRSSSYTDTMNQVINYSWWQTSFRSSVRLPLNLSSGKWIRSLQPEISSTWLKEDPGRNFPEHASYGHIRTLDYTLYWANQVLSSTKDIYPRWGQSISLYYRHTPFDGYNLGNFYAASSVFYFPGIGRHHSLYVGMSWQKNNDKPLSYSDVISYPRGFSNIYNNEFWSFTANYTLPLIYPDVHVGSLFYFKRFWLNLFYDHAENMNTPDKATYRSAGFELNTDVHILRFLAPFTFGLRLSYLPDMPLSSRFAPGLIYSVNIDAIR